MRWTTALVVLFMVLGSGLGMAEEIASHLGNKGPAYARGMTPQSLGWGPNDKAYPEKFIVNPGDGAEMAWIPPGEFMMGSSLQEQEWALKQARTTFGQDATPHWFDDEGPVHRVLITRGLWMYRHEVTNEQFRRANGHALDLTLGGASLSEARQPAAAMTWEEVERYCDKHGVSLPTEAEWEYACRAGGHTVFWWGTSAEDAGKYANVADRTAKAKFPDWRLVFPTEDGHAVAAPVGSYAPNAFGLYDMIGNVWEWCADWYGADYYQKSPRRNPRGPAKGEWRVARGGSWADFPNLSRSADRLRGDHRFRAIDFGFRPIIRSH